jgi:hypothetical protein
MTFDPNGPETFHVTDGLFFQRLPECAVRIIKTAQGRVDDPVIFDLTLNASQWASVIASMSWHGEEKYGFYRAMHFHCGDLPPVDITIEVAPGIFIGAQPPRTDKPVLILLPDTSK